MMDQKLNEGVAVPFFGHDAMTATAPIDMALRFGAHHAGKMYPFAGSHFQWKFHRQLSSLLQGTKTDVSAVNEINKIIENWIVSIQSNGFGCIGAGQKNTLFSLLASPARGRLGRDAL